MLGDSSLFGSSGAGEHDGGGAVGSSSNNNSGEDEKAGRSDGERSFGGNRWPRQETLALLKIRSDMDVAFREASVKGPLWDDVSRKLAEVGYQRSAKKCKEKFENVYKYHKRTKEGRGGKPDGKTYRFFDQLEALENHHNSISMQRPPQQLKPPHMSAPETNFTNIFNSHSQSQGVTPPPTTSPMVVVQSQVPAATTNHQLSSPPFQNAASGGDILSNSSTSTYSDEEAPKNKKSKWKDFFERLMKEVIQKQEDLQKKFMDAIEKREHERIAREEAWRMQEMARISREREILAQERSMAAAKDAAVMSFLQKVSEQHNHNQGPGSHGHPLNDNITTLPSPSPVQPQQQSVNVRNCLDNQGSAENGGSSSRWPKVEVEALIQLRSNLDSKYHDSGPKGPLWEEISSGMRRLGYNRSSKRCKEKWENINKYFKKVKESNKKRPQDSKTCPYFHQLDALYRNKIINNNSSSLPNQDANAAPLMVRPEQQWPPPENHMVDESGDQTGRNQPYSDGDNDDEMEEDEEEGDDDFELVANKQVGVFAKP